VENLADLLAWLTPRALLLAIVLPPVIRVVGHWIPEELFMVAIGVIAARSASPGHAALLLAAVFASHFVSDQAVYLLGRWLRPRLSRFPWVEKKLALVTDRLQDSPAALVSLIPARVLPLGRGAWLAGCGVTGVRWRRFAAFDGLALIAHVLTWCGLGWWLQGNLGRLHATPELTRVLVVWIVCILMAVLAAILLWLRAPEWGPSAVRAAKLASHRLRRPPR